MAKVNLYLIMIQEKLEWNSATGIKLSGNIWKPENKIKAVVVLIHGFGEHCMRYSPYIQMFENDGFAFVSYDQVGHGESEGKRGAIVSFELLLSDVQLCINKAKENFPELPIFLYGHSMGGNIVLNSLLQKKPDVSAAIITSPWLQLTKGPGAIVEGLVSFLTAIVPNATINSGLETKHMSTLSDEVDKYEQDSLNHGRISFRLFNEITKNGKFAMNNSQKAEIPILLVHGSSDNITSAKASQKAAGNNPSKIKFIEFEGCYHELHNDKDRSSLVSYVSEFINTQL